MKKVYLDNAATTALRREVIDEMVKVLAEDYGNASSSHSFGRNAKSVVELSRKSIAKQLNCSAQEIIFTSGGTEADNWILNAAVNDLKVQRIITSKIEHHAILHTAEVLSAAVSVDYVNVLPDGTIDLIHLSELLSANVPTLVSLMHVNNEIGTVLDLETVGNICRQYGAYFHSDTIQSVGKTEFDLHNLPIDFIAASAHKFHGPKGIGFAYVRKGIVLHPMLFGGEQEKGLRAGTEAVHNIAGMAKALELSYANLKDERLFISGLKEYAVKQFDANFPDAKVNGGNTFYNIVNVCFPFSPEKTSMILFNLDMKGIAVSRGSACQSGSIKPSHVLAEILSESDLKKPSLRISFSHFNTTEDVDYLVEALQSVK
ncbi:MAG: cysteine desulfurase [Flavobacterium sp.]|nr:MAG: cysteine desulfurase [Flavobacterium sp.]